jgi:SAM-dependent methyltransferase
MAPPVFVGKIHRTSPVTDLKDHWEKIYTDRSPLEVSWYQQEPTMSLQLIRNTQLAHDAPIIDVGGGASLLLDYLCNEGYTNIAVLDISAKALASAQERLGDRAGNVEWYAEDIVKFNPPKQFAVWHDRAVFHFLTDKSDRNGYVSVLKRALQPNGHFIIGAFSIDGPTKCSGLDIVQYDAKKLVSELGEGFELIEERSEVHVTPAGGKQHFTYFRFRRSPGSKGASGL